MTEKETSSKPKQEQSSVKIFTEAQKLKDTAPTVVLGAPDPAMLTERMAKEIINNESERAYMLSEAKKLEAKTALDEAKENASKPKPQGPPTTTLPPAMQGLGAGLPGLMMGGLGGLTGGNKAALVAAVLEKVPEADRMKFIQENREWVLGSGSSALEHLKKDADNGSAKSAMSDVAEIARVMSDTQNNAIILATQLLKPAVVGGNGGTAGGTADADKYIQMFGMYQQSITQLANGFTTSMDKVLQELRIQQESSKEVLRSLEDRLVSTERELIESRQEERDKRHEEEMQSIKAMVSQQGSTFQNYKQMIEQAKQIGLNVNTTTAEQQKADREYELQVKKLDMEAEREKRRLDLELSRAQGTMQKAALFGNILGMGVEAMALNKHVQSGGSRAAKGLASKF